jgi:hypothetical protein
MDGGVFLILRAISWKLPMLKAVSGLGNGKTPQGMIWERRLERTRDSFFCPL